MRTLFALALSIALVVALTSYALWTGQRTPGHYLSDLRITLAVNDGVPADRGNLLGIQPELFPADYQNIKRLHRKLAAYLQQARDRGLINPRTIVVLPEHIGTWLFASGEKAQLYQATTIGDALDWLSASNPLKFAEAMLRARGEDRVADAHLRMKAETMAHDYQTLFGGLAREFGVTLVAGSIVLPSPKLDNGQLRVGNGVLRNVSLTFGPTGVPLGPPQRQRFPAWSQRDYLRPAADAPLQVFDTPAGKLGILIGSDSWYPGNYLELDRMGVELIAIPAFVAGSGSWNAPWPADKVDGHGALPTTLAPLSEGEAWRNLTLAGQAPTRSARAGISVFMRGQFWDQGSSGHSFGSRNGHTVAETSPSASQRPADHGARLINLWL